MMSHYFKKNLVRLTAIIFSVASLQAMATDEKWEYTRKAEILKNLFNVVTWPTEKPLKNKIKICVLGKTPQSKYFEALQGQKVGTHHITIKTAADLAHLPKDCVAVFIPQSEANNQEEIVEHYAQKPVLLIADIENFAKKGGSMNFWILNGKVAITANLESLAKSHLKLDLKAFDQITLIPEGSDLPKD